MSKTKVVKQNNKVLLKGEGIHEHALIGNFRMVDGEVPDYAEIDIMEDSLLQHQKPNGTFSQEHQTLKARHGRVVMGMQVEFSPLDAKISKIWD